MKIDMGSKAITSRLETVNQLNKICLSLGKSKVQGKASENKLAKNEKEMRRVTGNYLVTLSE